MSDIIDPAEEDLEAFWTRAKNRAKLYPLEAVLGQDDLSSLRPNDYYFGSDRAEADRLCSLVIEGKKKATSSWLASYDAAGVPAPSVGELAILCDGSGNPRALLRDTRVEHVRFSQVDVTVADAEGEGTLTKWKADHDEFFRRECEDAGIEFDPEGLVLVEYFEVLYSHKDSADVAGALG